MKRHAAAPGGGDLQRMGEIIGKIIKQHISQPTADNHGEDKDHVKVFKLLFQAPAMNFPQLFAHQVVGGEKTEDIHQPVPANMQRSKTENYRVDVGEGEQGHGIINRKVALVSPSS